MSSQCHVNYYISSSTDIWYQPRVYLIFVPDSNVICLYYREYRDNVCQTQSKTIISNMPKICLNINRVPLVRNAFTVFLLNVVLNIVHM